MSPFEREESNKEGRAFAPFLVDLSGLGDSNARPLRPERSALPTALNPECAAKVHHFFESRTFLRGKNKCHPTFALLGLSCHVCVHFPRGEYDTPKSYTGFNPSSVT